MKKAGFPERADPEVFSDVVNPPEGFAPGLDAEYEQAVEEDRELGDEDSLTICGAGSDEDSVIEVGSSQEEAEEEEEEEEVQMASAPSKDPFKQSGQCPVSWDALRPVTFTCTVADPDARRRKGFTTRTGLGIRVDTPAGVVVSNFRGEASKDGCRIIYSARLEQTRFHHESTLGRRLGSNMDVLMAMESALTKQWTYISEVCSKGNGGKEPNDYRTYTIKLPEKCERDFRDPMNRWELCDFGEHGSVTSNAYERSLFYYLFLFTVKSKNVTPARAAANNLLYVDHSYSKNNPMNDQNTMRQQLRNNQFIQDAMEGRGRRSSGRKARNRSKRGERVTLEDTLEAMSISVQEDLTDHEECATPRSRPKSVKRRTRESTPNSASQRRARSKQKVITGIPLLNQFQAIDAAPTAADVRSNALVPTTYHGIDGRAQGRLSNETNLLESDINSIDSGFESAWSSDDKGAGQSHGQVTL